MTRAGPALTVLTLVVSLAGCRGELDTPLPGDSELGRVDGLALIDTAPDGNQTADLFLGWPAQLKQLALSAREQFGVPFLSVADGAELPPDALILDVRTAAESAVSRIEGARRLVDEAQRQAFLAQPHTRPVVVYCTAGWRSAEYTAELVAVGVQARNLEGGLCAWALEGGGLVDGAGLPTRRIHAFSDDFAQCVPRGFQAVFD